LVSSRRAELNLCLRITTSAILTLVVSQFFHLRFGLWAVLTAVLVTQINVGKSLKASADYFAGTLGGAILAGLVGTLIPHDTEIALAFVLLITLTPLALVAAENPRFSAGPFTAVLVLLAPTITHLGPIASASERVIEVAVGCIVGLAVSLVLLPARASNLSVGAAGRVLNLMAQEFPKLLGGLPRNSGRASRQAEEIDAPYASAQAAAIESAHERARYLSAAPDVQTQLRTLLRLQHDFMLIGRTAPLPTAFHARFEPLLDRIGREAVNHLRASSAALAGRGYSGTRPALDAALAAYATEMAVLSQEYLTTGVTADAVERILAFALALGQLRRDLNELERCVADQNGPVCAHAPKWLP
jgi:uncharacterized membrane protein YccC